MKKVGKIVSLVLALCLSINFVPVKNLQAATTADVSSNITIEIPELALEHYHYQYIIYDSWSGAYTGGFRLRNEESTGVITNWYMQFELDNEITDIWNAEIVSHVGNVYTIKYASYNKEIAPGTSIYIGFNANGSIYNLPDDVLVFGEVQY